MPAEILDAVKDREAWHLRLVALPATMQDVYFKPEYLALHVFAPDSRALCFVFSAKDFTWMYPFIFRSFSCIGSRDFEAPFHDIETAYGYGGPICNSKDAGFLSEAHLAFSEWCRSNNVVAEFVRFHPLLGNEKFVDPEIEVVLDRETRSLGLVDLSREDLPFNSDTRYMLKRAERSGVQIAMVSAKEYFDRFVELYLTTMERLSADSYYYFNQQYFLGLRDFIAESGFVLAAVLDKKWVAAGIFLQSGRWLHYHLSASNPRHRIPGVANLILWRAALVGQKAGLTRFHLGGGRSRQADDSLLRFKTMMSSDSHHFHVGKRILSPDLYRTIRNAWIEEYPALAARYGNRILCYHNA